MTQRQIAQDIDLDTGLKMVAQAFTEIASIKLQKIRRRIEKNRIFFEEISELFGAVQRLANKRGIVPRLEKNGTTTLILTSNNKFYGGLERRVLQFYSASIAKLSTDQILLGRSASDFFNKKAIILEEDLPTEAELQNLTNLIKNYNQVLVFYPLFKSVLVQTPFAVDLTKSNIAPSKINLDYILEPEIEKMWQFFDSQILKLLLEQTFLEAELSRTAARLTSMDQAQEMANHAIVDLKRALAVVKRSINNNRILETESAMHKFRRAHDLG